jgi:hypothetical protein
MPVLDPSRTYVRMDRKRGAAAQTASIRCGLEPPEQDADWWGALPSPFAAQLVTAHVLRTSTIVHIRW